MQMKNSIMNNRVHKFSTTLEMMSYSGVEAMRLSMKLIHRIPTQNTLTAISFPKA